jgi:predicted membrane-bound spermidine synthase
MKHPKRGIIMFLYLTVFITGLSIMSAEILASRILAPHFGNTVFLWGSIISTFLTGLALGYYIGGIIADRRPSYRILSAILILSAFLFLLFPIYSKAINNAVFDLNLGLKRGPLLASMSQFLLPMIFLGMVTPYSVKLKTKRLSVVGSTAGRLYAVSSIGSITGTLVTTFYLILLAGIQLIIFLNGLVLLVLAVAAYLFHVYRARNECY